MCRRDGSLTRLYNTNTELEIIVGMGSLVAIFCRAMMSPMIVRFGRRNVLYMSLFFSFLPMAVVPLFEHFAVLALLTTISGWGGGIREYRKTTLAIASDTPV